jgi:multidrug efflux pump subunit AcrB
VQNDTEYLVTTGKFLSSSEDVENLVVGVNSNMPVYLKQVATIQDGPQNPKNYVSFGYGKANEKYAKNNSEYPAVTISIAKVKGADAMKISEKILERVENLKKTIIPTDVHVEVSRNYGETASHKVGELLLHLGVAIIAVTVWNALFWVIFTFTGINSIAKSFLQNSRGYQIYLYSLVHPVAYILGKTIYNFFLTFLMALFSYILYSVFIKNY